MARFERDGQFFEVWVERGESLAADALQTRSGRIGELVEPVIVEPGYPWSVRRDYQGLQLAKLRDGWHRVRDPAHEAAYDDEPIDPAIEAALRAGDATAALVLADVLQQRGHPRGELIAIQHARLAAPDDAALAAAEHTLFDNHPLWPFDPYVYKGDGGVAVVWENGFVRRVKISGFVAGASEDLLWDVLRHPSARFLRELVLGCHHAGDQYNELVCETIMHAGPTPPLRSLVIADFDDSEIDSIDISRAPIGRLVGLGARYPGLESVILKGTGDVALGDLALLKCRRFALRTSTLVRPTLAAILAAPWPVLEELELWFGDPERRYGADCELADALPLFRCALPKLRSLKLRNAMFSDEIVPSILAWPGAAELRELDFALGTLSPDGADALIAGRAALPKLAKLGVFECALTPSALERLQRAFPGAVDDTPISPAETSRGQKSARYVSVSE